MKKEKAEKQNVILKLFLTFLKLGAITFGGGYVMLTLIRDEFVEKKKWVTEDELLQVCAVAESTPGPVAINAATYIGAKMCGFWGALVATFAVVLPAFIVSFVIATYLNAIMQYEIVQNAFLGIKAGVGVLIFLAGIDMLKKMEKSLFNVLVCVISFIAMLLIDVFSLNFSSIYIILIFGAISLLIFAIGNKKNKNNTQKEALNSEDSLINSDAKEENNIEKIDVVEEEKLIESQKESNINNANNVDKTDAKTIDNTFEKGGDNK